MRNSILTLIHLCHNEQLCSVHIDGVHLHYKDFFNSVDGIVLIL